MIHTADADDMVELQLRRVGGMNKDVTAGCCNREMCCQLSKLI
jgi:hypothetical protein